jgi:hypothetical protein
MAAFRGLNFQASKRFSSRHEKRYLKAECADVVNPISIPQRLCRYDRISQSF